MQPSPTSPSQPQTLRMAAAVRRVSVSDATPTQPPYVRVYFRDTEAAHYGFSQLLPGLASDPRTTLDLAAPMPTLTYPLV